MANQTVTTSVDHDSASVSGLANGEGIYRSKGLAYSGDALESVTVS